MRLWIEKKGDVWKVKASKLATEKYDENSKMLKI
mgnify:CR=1 FL=1